MRVASYLLASATLVVAVTAASKPYAPDLYARSALLDDVEVVASRSIGNAPYAPKLYSRSELHEDSFELKRRFLGETSNESSTLQARHWACSKDAQCGSAGYCSTSKGRCFTKINNGKKCSRDVSRSSISLRYWSLLADFLAFSFIRLPANLVSALVEVTFANLELKRMIIANAMVIATMDMIASTRSANLSLLNHHILPSQSQINQVNQSLNHLARINTQRD